MMIVNTYLTSEHKRWEFVYECNFFEWMCVYVYIYTLIIKFRFTHWWTNH